MSRETVNQWLKELGSRAGIGMLQLNDQGVCAVEYDSSIDLVFEVPDKSSILYMYTPITPIPDTGENEVFKRLLKQNFFSDKRIGSVFAIDETNRNIILCYAHPIEHLDYSRFEKMVENFLESAFQRWQELNSPVEPDIEPPQPDNTDDEVGNFPMDSFHYRA